jgi:hypothetical protein
VKPNSLKKLIIVLNIANIIAPSSDMEELLASINASNSPNVRALALRNT